MLSYRRDSRAIACLSTLLHGEMSECFCRHGCHLPENEFLWGQVSPLCRSQSEVHYTDRSPLQRKKSFFLLFRWHFLRFGLCPLPQQKSVAPSLALPSVRVSATPGTPRAFPSPGGTVPAPSAGVTPGHPAQPPHCRLGAQPPSGWGLNFW